MSRAGKKGGKATFVLFTPKWSKIKDHEEIEKRLSKTSKTAAGRNTQLSNSNRPILQAIISPLNQVLNADNDASDTKSVAGSKAGSEANFDINNDEDEADLIFGVLATETDET